MEKKVVIIGSGPAGLSAAVSLRENHITPLLLERQDVLSSKLLASGGTRCNFSNRLGMEEFMRSFGRNGSFMRNALQYSFREWLVSFLEKQDVRSVVHDDFFYFPSSGRAVDVRDAFVRYARPQIRTNCQVMEILPDESTSRVAAVRTADGQEIPCSGVILAGGSCAWKGLGSMAGLTLAEKAGHRIVTPLPAVAPLLVEDGWVKTLAGVTLPQGELILKSRRRTLTTRGSILFTHQGLSGFPALDLAGEAAQVCADQGKCSVYLNCNTSLDVPAWEKLLSVGRKEEGTLFVKNLLGRYLPKSLAGIICSLCHCQETALCRLSAESVRLLPRMLTCCPLTVCGSGPMDCAMAMRGGVSLKEVNPASMESRLMKGLYFAGEILDLDGPCGGYNIQWAVSSGRFAGACCAKEFFS